MRVATVLVHIHGNITAGLADVADTDRCVARAVVALVTLDARRVHAHARLALLIFRAM